MIPTFDTFGPIDWLAYYKRPMDGPECLRRMGYPPFPCKDCHQGEGCRRLAVEGSNQCPQIRHWMYDFWPLLTGKIRAAHGDSSSEDGKGNNTMDILREKGGIVNGTS